MRDRLFAFLHILSRPAVALGGSLAIALLAIAGAWYLTSVSPSGVSVRAVLAPLTQEVDVSGAVAAARDTDLSFPSAGQVAAIFVTVGQQVGIGQTLAALNHAGQSAALEGAEANLAAANARLAQLQAGTRPEQLAIATQTVASAESSSYVAADAAVHATVDTLFSNPRSTNPTLLLFLPDATLLNKIQNERIALEPLFISWNANGTSSAVIEQNLAQVAVFLDDLAKALAATPPSSSISAATLAVDASAIAAARTAVAGAHSSLTAAEGALALAEAGATPQDIAAALATVAAAQAAVDSAHVAVGNTYISAPMSGTITRQDANLGETVSPNVPLISMIANGKFEAVAQVSENDIAKITLGDAVVATFTDYPGVSFPAIVTEVSPAPTLSGGSASYTVKATFANNDARIILGRSVNLSIVTGGKASALVVPASAVITDNNQKFVYVLSALGAYQKTAVTTGMTSSAGMTEIVSGLEGGTQVLTFGASHTP